ncbi:integrase domain-containing protein [Pseudomonas violetae]|uniref:Integrase domain-containing protein n=1 Tax=Pseudomonas violetae TaxID=2915813 RepID=A0ABT0F8V9_9PSED|nr:integrase domain-containing protein [Pseudomonas violetae]MCK1794279.1 integrase domain-containing protein [Pseudomonas violetae]
MSRNYGLGSRDMSSAARIALDRAARRGELSFSSVATLSERFSQFVDAARAQGIGRLERITPDLVQAYGQQLATRVQGGELSPAYAQNLVSAINTVMQLLRDWTSVSPTKTCGIALRCAVRSIPPLGVDRTVLTRSLEPLRDDDQLRAAAVAVLARELGLRSKEAALLNAHKALQEARERAQVTIVEGTKGGRSRTVPVLQKQQLSALANAATLQGAGRSLIPVAQNWKQFRENTLRQGRVPLQQVGITGYHDLRAAYACDRYQQLTGHPAPVIAGGIVDKHQDRLAREQISAELGHGRIDVVAEYIGGRG